MNFNVMKVRDFFCHIIKNAFRILISELKGSFFSSGNFLQIKRFIQVF